MADGDQFVLDGGVSDAGSGGLLEYNRDRDLSVFDVAD
jgi:hypothetical protein